MSMTDFRALCAELIEAIDSETADWEDIEELKARARALLAQPVAEGPSDEELDELYFYIDAWHVASWRHYARAVLAKWAHPTPQPVAVSERLPGPEDCDEQGRCWWLKQRANPDHDLLMPTWHLQRQGPAGTTFFRFTHWLPAHALPTPEAKP
jgi:hypothetical protein